MTRSRLLDHSITLRWPSLALNLLIDGALILEDRQGVLVEVKYRLGWAKACQAEWQLRRALRFPEVQTYQPCGAIVVFEEFAGDWSRDFKGAPRG